MKILKLLITATALSLAACGGDSIQSPDFTPALLGLSLSSTAEVDETATADYKTPIGEPASLDVTGTFSLPPGSATDVEDRPTDADFTLSPAGIATVVDGALVGQTTGVVTVTASKKDDISGDTRTSESISFRITPAEIRSIAIDPSAAQTISEFQSQTYSAIGTFTDGQTRPVSATWTDQAAVDIVTFSPNPAATTTAAPVSGSAGSSTTVRATSVDDTSLFAEVTLNINSVTLTGVASVTCTPSVIGVGENSACVATGSFSDGSSGAISDSLVTWSSSNTSAATIDANGDALGVTGGQTTTITATLTSPASSASTTLTITDARCTTPFLSSAGDAMTPPASLSSTAGTGAGTPFSQTCLVCDVLNPQNIIDGDIDTFGSLSITLGLLNPLATVSVSGATTYPGGTAAGFVVAQPAGLLLSAELLSTLTVTTLLDGAPQASGGARPQPGTLTTELPLTVTLLGMFGAQDAALISFVPTTPFDGIALTLDGGVVSALPSINVFQACATADTTVTTP